MENKLKLEVWESYRSRAGDKWEIDDVIVSMSMPFLGWCEAKKCVNTFAENGRCSLGREHEDDLIAPWEDETQTKEIEDAKQ